MSRRYRLYYMTRIYLKGKGGEMQARWQFQTKSTHLLLSPSPERQLQNANKLIGLLLDAFPSVFWQEEAHALSTHHGISAGETDQDLPGLVVTYPHHSAANWRSANTRESAVRRCGANLRGERSTW